MKTVFIILAIVIGVLGIALFVLHKMAVSFYPLLHRKEFCIPLNEIPFADNDASPTDNQESIKDDSPSLFETIVEESRKQS